jgi:hypothetical protein
MSILAPASPADLAIQDQLVFRVLVDQKVYKVVLVLQVSKVLRGHKVM